MHLVIFGGSTHHVGGVEAFCARASQALAREGGYETEVIPTGTAYFNLSRLPAVGAGLRRLVALRGKRVDCVWIQYVNFPDLVYVLTAKMLGFRVMVTPHLGSNWRSQSNPLLRELSGMLLGLADRIALISPTQQDEIRLPRQVPRSFIRNFLPESIWSYGLTESRSTASVVQLAHAGRLSEGKGTFLFVDVCCQLRALGVPFLARIAGGTDEETFARLKAMVADRSLQDSVAILGRISDTELLELLQASDVLVHLSKIDSYPLIVLESLALGVFPLCMELAGARDMVRSYDGKIVPEAGAAAEAAAFLGASGLDDLRRRSIEAGARLRIDYSWKSCVQALDDALSATVAADGAEQAVASSAT